MQTPEQISQHLANSIHYEDNPFPFERVQPNSLIPGQEYFIQRLEYKYGKLPGYKEKFTKLKGRFVRLEQIYHPTILSTTPENDNGLGYYESLVVFDNLFILKKSFKGKPYFVEKNNSSSSRMNYARPLIKIKQVANNSNMPVNGGREVYLRSNEWEFGIPNEEIFLSNQIFTKLKPQLPEYMQLEVKSFLRSLGGRKSRTRRNKRSKKSNTKRRR